MLKLVTHNIYEGGELPPFSSNLFYEYWLAGDGLYLRAKRSGLEVLMPVTPAEVRGLPTLTPYFRLDYPLVPRNLFLRMVELARQARDSTGRSIEKLYHLHFSQGLRKWVLEVPAQVQTTGSVKPLDSEAGSSYEQAFLELHSHHRMPAFFSTADDRDEARSFRIFAVIGDIFGKVEIRVRVGVFGYFWLIDPALVFELPEENNDTTASRPTLPPFQFACKRSSNSTRDKSNSNSNYHDEEEEFDD